MKLDDGSHLTYCTNIHAGETWPEVRDSLAAHLPPIKAALCPDRPFGLGLRLAGIAANALRNESAFEELQAFLDANQSYVFTINGFPYGPFHGQAVKAAVYQPDWTHQVRLAYTNDLADLLARLLPPGMEGSISTVPGTFKPLAVRPGVTQTIAHHMIDHVAHLVRIERLHGKIIALALEPEPCCMIETIAETIAFFKTWLFSEAAIGRLAGSTGLARTDAEAALRRHVGVCYDVCHAACEFEDPKASLADLRAAGISIPKLQLSTALRIPDVRAAMAAPLRAFDEPVYLHQVIERRDGEGGDDLVRHQDLGDALSVIEAAIGCEWRVHFHVPIFRSDLDPFSTTQDFLIEILAMHRQQPISAHLEVETYSFDVLPEHYRHDDMADAIIRELRWVSEMVAPRPGRERLA